MNTDIKKLVESLFDDDIDDILKGMTDDNVSKQLENNMFSLNELKSLLEQLHDPKNTLFKHNLLSCENLNELSIKSQEGNGIYIPIITISLYENNIDIFKDIFDILYEYNVRLDINSLIFILENKTDNFYSIKELLDLTKYNDILRIQDFSVNYGKLKNLEGFPKIWSEYDFQWISEIISFKGFPKNDYNISLYFWGSSLPKDWSGCPTQLQNLRYESNIEPVDENDIEDIKKQIGSLTNIPYDLTFELNNPNKIGYNFVGGSLINPKWKPDVKREIRSYIGYCLKSQYKNIMGLKKRICNSEKSI